MKDKGMTHEHHAPPRGQKHRDRDTLLARSPHVPKKVKILSLFPTSSPLSKQRLPRQKNEEEHLDSAISQFIWRGEP